MGCPACIQVHKKPSSSDGRKKVLIVVLGFFGFVMLSCLASKLSLDVLEPWRRRGHRGGKQSLMGLGSAYALGEDQTSLRLVIWIRGFEGPDGYCMSGGG